MLTLRPSPCSQGPHWQWLWFRVTAPKRTRHQAGGSAPICGICVICGSAFDLEWLGLSLADNRETLNYEDHKDHEGRQAIPTFSWSSRLLGIGYVDTRDKLKSRGESVFTRK